MERGKCVKILQVGFGNNPGGIEAFVMNYYRELSADGITFDFLCMHDQIAYAKEINTLGGSVFYVPNIKKNYFGYVKEYKKILKTEKYDVVHVNMLSAANIVPLRIAKQLGVKKIIAHAHSTSTQGCVRKLLNDINRSKIGDYANIRFACSKNAGEWFFNKEVDTENEIFIIHNAISIEKFQFSKKKREEYRKKLGFHDDFVIGHVGRFAYEKNQEGVLNIFRAVLKKIPNAKLCFVGGGSGQHYIKELAEKYGLIDKICFAGVCDDVENYLSAMDLFILPSFYEGLPFTVIEAQANGLPCVLSDVITDEAIVLKNRVKKCSLQASLEEWADTVFFLKDYGREDMSVIRHDFEEMHFDIKKEADRLKKIYQE